MLEDRVLIYKLKHGNREALRSIYEKYESDLLTLAANLLDDAYSAEDVVQDVFIGFVQGVDEFRLRGTLKGYLATCAANRARDYARKSRRRPTVAIDEAEQVASESAGPVQLVINNEESLRLRQALGNVPYEQREVIMLHLHGGLKFRQIAKLQKVSIKTAQSRYRYGLDKLRSILNSEAEK